MYSELHILQKIYSMCNPQCIKHQWKQPLMYRVVVRALTSQNGRKRERSEIRSNFTIINFKGYACNVHTWVINFSLLNRWLIKDICLLCKITNYVHLIFHIWKNYYVYNYILLVFVCLFININHSFEPKKKIVV